MVHSIQSCALHGLEAHPIVCEVDLAAQLPAFSLVGLPSSLTQESRERIRAAVVNSGFEWPARKVTVNLLPANLPKWGCHFELAMALGILGAASERRCPANIVAMGELALSGHMRPCGWLPAVADWLASAARSARARYGEPFVLIAHESDARELRLAAPELASLCEIGDVRSLVEAQRFVTELERRVRPAPADSTENSTETSNDFSRSWLELRTTPARPPALDLLAAVENEPLATIAALVAIAGRHHCLFAGPHGAGKSMIVRAICEAAPAISAADRSVHTSLLRSFGDSFQTSGATPVVRLQTSVSRAALEGALLTNGQVLPGELTRAHLGILVADEFLEYRRDVIEAFRQPLDEGVVRLQRAKFRTALPSKFQLLASTNLCPCGGYGRSGGCRCAPPQRLEYQRKLSGPIIDRFDMIVLLGSGKRNRQLRSQLPADVVELVDELLVSEHWPARLKAACGPRILEDTDPAELWSQTSTDATARGRLKIAQVARTLAALVGEPRQARHLRLAIVLRDELLRLLAPQCLKI